LYFAKNHEEFLSFVEVAVTEEHDVEKSLKFAQENDWELKASNMVKLIREFNVKKLR